MIHVGLNLIFCVPGETGGMETAARRLIPALAAQPGLRLTGFVNREAAGTFDGLEEVVVPVRAANRVEWVRGEQQLLPRLAARAGVDLLHSLGSTAPLWGRFRRVTTVHDLHYRIVPEAHFGIRALGMRVLVPAAVRRSHRLIAVSQNTRDDVVRMLHADPARIDVVAHGIDRPAEVRAWAPDDPPFVLCPGAKRPHKNAEAVLEALSAMDPRPALVVTGYASPYDSVLRDHAEAVGVELRMPGYVADAELDDLYARAAAVAVMSRYEGFGLPVLEAMVRGVPVVCSDRSSLPDVAGDAALLADPDDPAAIRRAVERALADPEPLRAKGAARAAEFTWERAARLTADSYRRA